MNPAAVLADILALGSRAADLPREAGATIPAEQVAIARRAGIHVYVSPHGAGSGVVVVAGQPLPQVLVDDLRGNFPRRFPTTLGELRASFSTAVARAEIAADVPIATLYLAPVYDADGLVSVEHGGGFSGIPHAYRLNGRLAIGTRESVLAQMAPHIAANPGIQVLDLTTDPISRQP